MVILADTLKRSSGTDTHAGGIFPTFGSFYKIRNADLDLGVILNTLRRPRDFSHNRYVWHKYFIRRIQQSGTIAILQLGGHYMTEVKTLAVVGRVVA